MGLFYCTDKDFLLYYLSGLLRFGAELSCVLEAEEEVSLHETGESESNS